MPLRRQLRISAVCRRFYKYKFQRGRIWAFMDIKFTDICFITEDVPRLRAFYEAVFSVEAEGDEIHSGIIIDGLTLVFDHVDIADENPTFRYIEAGGANNVIVGFNVDDADAEYKRLLALGVDMLNEPTTHPWGARSFQFRDPDGNILNFRSPVKEK